MNEGTVDIEAEIWGKATALTDQRQVREALHILLAGFDRCPYYHFALQISQWLRVQQTLEQEFAENRRIRLAMVGSFTLEPLGAFMEVECLRAGLWPQVYVGTFNQFRSDILAPDSKLYAFSPDVILLTVTLEALLPGFDPFGETRRERIDEAVSLIKTLADSVHQRSAALFVVQNFAMNPWAPAVPQTNPSTMAPRAFVRELNLRLGEAFLDDSRLLVLDLDFVLSRYGTSRAVDPKMRYLAGMEFGESVLPVLARNVAGYVKTLKGLARKCVVVDLDNTLWGGVIGEDGLDNIRLGADSMGRAYQDFQRYLLALWRRGVLLAVNSHNNPDDALEAIRTHPGMVLREEHFASIQVNWDDKARNMTKIAEDLNIGLESMIFLDDNPAERLNMQQQLPQVLTVALPADPSRYIEAVSSLNDLEALALTEEDRRRGAIYAEERARTSLKAKAGTYEDYLRALQMAIKIRPLEECDLSRAAQLTQRTNQFNMTTRRYTAAQLGAHPRGFTIRLSDTFGDSGLVGLALVDIEGATWHLSTLLMSCRVLGRRVEFLFVERLASLAQKAGASRLTGEYIPTSKNKLAGDFYSSCGFSFIEKKDGVAWFELPLTGKEFPVPDWVTFTE